MSDIQTDAQARKQAELDKILARVSGGVKTSFSDLKAKRVKRVSVIPLNQCGNIQVKVEVVSE